MHVPLIYIVQELREINFFIFLPASPLLDYFPQQESGQPDHQPESYGFDCRIHQDTPEETGIRTTPRNPEAPATKLDAVRSFWIRKFPKNLILPFLGEKGAEPAG
jgi:hypothetical protein